MSSLDLWGETSTPADVNDSDFGVADEGASVKIITRLDDLERRMAALEAVIHPTQDRVMTRIEQRQSLSAVLRAAFPHASVQACHALARNGWTPEAVRAASDAELLTVRNFGPGSLRDVRS